MKKNILIYSIILITVALFSCKRTQDKFTTVTDRIVYDAQIMNNDPDVDPWINNMEGPQRDKFINLIFDAVKGSKIKIYDKDHKEVKYEDVISHLMTYDTLKSSNIKNKESKEDIIVSNSFDKNKISQIRFDEKWSMNEKTYEIKKDVFGFCPVMAEVFQNGTSKNQQPLFWIYADTLNTDTANGNYIITKKIQYTIPIKAAEKSPEWWINNIEPTQRETFINTLIDAVLSNKVKAYDYAGNLMTKDLYNKYYNPTDTLDIENPETGKMESKVIKHEIDRKDITSVRFIEEWSLNTKTFKFTKRVLAVCPVLKINDNDGNFKAWMAIFYIYFDNSLVPAKKQ